MEELLVRAPHALFLRRPSGGRYVLASMTPAPPIVEQMGGDAKRSYVRQMFTAIAPRYDLLNHVLSLNIDRRWRRRAIARLNVERNPVGAYLDLCAGTLDVSAALSVTAGFRGLVIGADFAEPMLKAGA